MLRKPPGRRKCNSRGTPASCDRADSDLPEDVQTRALLDTLREPPDEVNVNEVLPLGRALKNFPTHYPRRPGLPAGPCPGPSYGTSLAAPTVFTMEPRGDVSICWGVTIGSARRQSLGQVLRGYDASTHPLASTLLRGGPAALLGRPECDGFEPKPAYANDCELCREVTHYLQRRSA